MSIIEAIKNGARFRHKEGLHILSHHITTNGMIVVEYSSRLFPSVYAELDAKNSLELIPEEETLWVAVSILGKTGSVLPFYYKSTNFYQSEGDAIEYGEQNFGPGNYTIHSITRTK